MDDKDKIRAITLSISSELEVIPFAPQDFTPQNPCKQRSTLFVKDILKTGIPLV